MATPDIHQLKGEHDELVNELEQIERQLFNLETSYLETPSPVGNLLTGWGKVNDTSNAGTKKKKKRVNNDERLFSKSSATAFEVCCWVLVSWAVICVL